MSSFAFSLLILNHKNLIFLIQSFSVEKEHFYLESPIRLSPYEAGSSADQNSYRLKWSFLVKIVQPLPKEQRKDFQAIITFQTFSLSLKQDSTMHIIVNDDFLVVDHKQC